MVQCCEQSRQLCLPTSKPHISYLKSILSIGEIHRNSSTSLEKFLDTEINQKERCFHEKSHLFCWTRWDFMGLHGVLKSAISPLLMHRMLFLSTVSSSSIVHAFFKARSFS